MSKRPPLNYRHTQYSTVQRAKMWIQVRTMDGRKNVRIDDLSKLTKIEELREMLVEPFEVVVEKQRLFYRGKQVRERVGLFVQYGPSLLPVVYIVHGTQCFVYNLQPSLRTY